jgi:Domain of unknown function (DUF4267)
MATEDTRSWVAIAPAIGLVLLGVVFILSPALGAAIFGLPLPQGTAAGYLPAIGVRDLAFGLYILALAMFSGPRAVGIVLAVTVLIPVGDILVLLAAIGLSSPGHLLAHAASGIYMAGAAAWVLRSGSRKGAGT